MLVQPEEIMAVLGYYQPDDYPLSAWDNLLNCSHVVLERLDKLAKRLTSIDEALDQASLDSMATKVDKLEVNYGSHISILKAEASRIIKDIANIIQCPIRYNRYKTSNSSQLSFTSYW